MGLDVYKHSTARRWDIFHGDIYLAPRDLNINKHTKRNPFLKAQIVIKVAQLRSIRTSFISQGKTAPFSRFFLYSTQG